jgi:hypothetical protein
VGLLEGCRLGNEETVGGVDAVKDGAKLGSPDGSFEGSNEGILLGMLQNIQKKYMLRQADVSKHKQQQSFVPFLP